MKDFINQKTCNDTELFISKYLYLVEGGNEKLEKHFSKKMLVCLSINAENVLGVLVVLALKHITCLYGLYNSK